MASTEYKLTTSFSTKSFAAHLEIWQEQVVPHSGNWYEKLSEEFFRNSPESKVTSDIKYCQWYTHKVIVRLTAVKEANREGRQCLEILLKRRIKRLKIRWNLLQTWKIAYVEESRWCIVRFLSSWFCVAGLWDIVCASTYSYCFIWSSTCP